MPFHIDLILFQTQVNAFAVLDLIQLHTAFMRFHIKVVQYTIVPLIPFHIRFIVFQTAVKAPIVLDLIQFQTDLILFQIKVVQ